jgi:TusA-related sulfurtransferase
MTENRVGSIPLPLSRFFITSRNSKFLCEGRMQIDASGKACPMPVMMAEEALSQIGEGSLEVIVDNIESALNVSGYATQNGMY